MKILLAVACAFAVAAVPASATLLIPPDGYLATDTQFPVAPGAYVGGFDIDPNGNFIVFNGGDIQEITRTGSIVRTILSVGDGVSGSFIKVRGDRIYYGESTNGTIGEIGLDGFDHRVITTLSYNYDFDFDPLGRAFVVTGSAFGAPASTVVHLLDLNTGVTDEIAGIDGPSGPIAFDQAGSLYYGTVSSVFGARGGQSVLSWTASQINTAIGSGNLTAQDAAVMASDIDSPAGFAWGFGGDLYFTSVVASPGNIWRVSDGAGLLLASVNPEIGISWLTTLRYDSATDSLSTAAGWMDANWNTYSAIASLTPVPEASSLGMLAGMMGLLATRRRWVAQKKGQK